MFFVKTNFWVPGVMQDLILNSRFSLDNFLRIAYLRYKRKYKRKKHI